MAGVAATALPEQIQAELKRISDDIKSYAEKAQDEIKAHAKLSDETRVKVDQLLTTQGELQARLQSAEQMVAKLESGGGRPAAPQSMGEQLTSNEAYQAFVKNPGAKFRTPVQAAITSGGSSGGAAIDPMRVPGIITPPNQRLFVRDLLSWGRTSSNSIEYVRETGFTNAADVVSENPASGKPESDIEFELDSENVATIAHWVHASKQVLADAPMMQSYIDGRLRYGLKLKEEAQLLKGSGVGLNINGIVTQASAYVNPGVTVTAENRIDRLRLAILQAELAEYYADGIVLHPTDWAAIELLKTSEEHQYLFANPRMMTAASLWSRPVVPSQSMDVGEFLVGSFQQGAQGWDRQDVALIVSLEDRDNVIKNMVTLLVEERLALTVYRPEAFVTGDFDGLSGG
ncbi:MAG TPA: phage major capsid protein [Gammaproteobacteria bacterium]|nr:phage major capsid protein [Gammaproteobacteria bacterium]MCH77394.1 phage major capsid protein [Gammaproteobacteria bacterium]